MNMKQKMIVHSNIAHNAYLRRWMNEVKEKGSENCIDRETAEANACAAGMDAALSVAADPANWTDEMQLAAEYAAGAVAAEFAAVINHIKGLWT